MGINFRAAIAAHGSEGVNNGFRAIIPFFAWVAIAMIETTTSPQCKKVVYACVKVRSQSKFNFVEYIYYILGFMFNPINAKFLK